MRAAGKQRTVQRPAGRYGALRSKAIVRAEVALPCIASCAVRGPFCDNPTGEAELRLHWDAVPVQCFFGKGQYLFNGYFGYCCDMDPFFFRELGF